MSDTVIKFLEARNVEFAAVEDSAGAILRMITDPKVTGRSFAIVPRSFAPRGYIDVDLDDYEEGSLLGKLQGLAGGVTHRVSVSLQATPPLANTCPDLIAVVGAGAEDSHSMVTIGAQGSNRQLPVSNHLLPVPGLYTCSFHFNLRRPAGPELNDILRIAFDQDCPGLGSRVSGGQRG